MDKEQLKIEVSKLPLKEQDEILTEIYKNKNIKGFGGGGGYGDIDSENK